MSLIESARDNDLPALKTLIARGADVNAVGEHGRTALWFAVRGGHLELATTLIDAKADVDKANICGETPLHSASNDDGSIKSILFLLKHKANVNALSIDGNSPLHFASSYGHLTYVRILVAAGVEKDRPNKRLYTPLAYAIISNHRNVAEFLLHSGAKIENVSSRVYVPTWMFNIIRKRRSVMSSALTLKGLLKRRLGLSKDVTNLIALYFWSERLK